MKRLLSGSMLMTLLVMQTVARAQGSTDSLLRELTTAIEKAPAYDAAKEQRIAGLQTVLQQDRMASPGTLFPIYERLYHEYQIFNYDSAYEYAGKLQQIAYRLGDPERITQARLHLCFILLSSGLYRETLDSLRATEMRGKPDSLRAIYFTL